MIKKYSLKITASARRDIEVIWDYISPDNPANAICFIDEIEKKINTLKTLPERNPVIPESSYFPIDAYRHLIYKDYRIVYRIQSGTVLVLRILHGSKLLDLFSLD